jgi:hypothetical protein
MRPYLITAKLMRPSNMKRFPTPGLEHTKLPRQGRIKTSRVTVVSYDKDEATITI